MNKAVIAIAVSVLTAGPALASDKGDVMAVLKQWISGEAGTVACQPYFSTGGLNAMRRERGGRGRRVSNLASFTGGRIV
jgi:hypothetical protein